MFVRGDSLGVSELTTTVGKDIRICVWSHPVDFQHNQCKCKTWFCNAGSPSERCRWQDSQDISGLGILQA